MKTSPLLEVRHFEARRYFVRSAAGSGREHLVDLEENKGLGECGCEDHQFRVQPVYATLADGQAPPDGDISCKHVRAARQFERQTADTTVIEIPK